MKISLLKHAARWLCCLCLALPAAAASSDVIADSRLRVLFLGDDGSHAPAERFRQVEPVLEANGIELDYTKDLADLNASKLAGYDCLIIYADHGDLREDAERALMEFVTAGGGLVPLHCGLACFRNSARYASLVGGAAGSGSGKFQERFVRPEHPILKGLRPIEGKEQICGHAAAQGDRIVLTERLDGAGAEAWTWIREHERGRVFCTAWGHDAETWSNPAFHALVERGIRWASANSPTRLRPRTGLPPLEYVDAPAPLPNYVPNARWGTQAEPFRTMQAPLGPAESMRHLVTFPEFEVSLFASEPDVIKPIWMAWDHRGRLWIAETVDYPNELQPPGQGRDRLKICEDIDGNGRADAFTIFADKLSIPTSFVFAGDGVIVIHSGRTEFLRDTDGDDRADERRILFEGWGTEDTHATASNLRWGFDNWIWGVVGYSGFRGTVGGKEVRFGQGIFRFKPDGSALEFVRSSNNNTWGLGFSEEGIVFGSTANGNASMYLPIPNRYYEAVLGWSASRLETIADSQRFYPLTDVVRQVDYHGRYTAGAGSALYTARQFPSEYWNRVQFVAEPTGHLLGKFHLEPRGADFVAHNGRNFLASTDEWTSPVVAEVGPDGALWVSDWYNYVIQHNPTPRGFRTGRGNAYETPLRDKSHGRIYRVSYRGATSGATPRLDPSDPKALIAGLKSDNMLWRLHAQRLLVHRGGRDVVSDLQRLIEDRSMDEIGLNPGAIHALWTLHGLGVLEDDQGSRQIAVAALRHPSAGVRKAAVSVLPPTSEMLPAVLQADLLKDPSPQVRLAALLTLSEMPPSDSAGQAVLEFLKDSENAGDRWLVDAATTAAARNDAAFLGSVLASYRPAAGGDLSGDSNPVSADAATSELGGAIGRVVRLVTTHYAQRGPVESIVATLTRVKDASRPVAISVLDGLVEGWPGGTSPKFGPAEERALLDCMNALPDDTQDRLLALSQRWGLTDLFGAQWESIMSRLRSQLSDTGASDDARIGAARRLIGIDASADAVRLVLDQVQVLTPPNLASGLIQTLVGSRAEVAGAIMEHWRRFSPTARRAAIGVLMRRPEWTRVLLDAVADGKIHRTDIALEQWSQMKQSPNRMIARRADRLSETIGPVSPDRQEVVERLLPLAREKGDPARGREVFAANCAVCHYFNGEGGKVGPDLSGIHSRERGDILLEILDPNRSVEANYRLWNVNTRDGETLSGVLAAETQTTIELLDVNGQKHVVQRSDIESLEGSALSIMPAGFETLPEADLKGLIEYLATTTATAGGE